MTHDVRVRALLLVAGYAGASALAYASRGWYLDALLPGIGLVVDQLLPDGIERTALAIGTPRGQSLVVLDTALTQPIQVGRLLVPAGEVIGASTLSAYALHHAALVHAILIAWPARTVAGRVVLLVLALPAALLATLLDIPFVLAGLVHELLLEAGTADLASRNLTVYYEFVHRGGRLGLSIAAAVAVGLGVHAWEARRTARDPLGQPVTTT